MRKIPTLFRRDPDDMRRLLPEVNPGCEWVVAGAGTATRKYDGTCVMWDGGDWWARREVKPGRPEPVGFVAVETDPATGKTVGWEPAELSPFAKYMDEAVAPLLEFGSLIGAGLPAGTYELVGPRVNGNPEGAERHRLERHETAEILVLEGCDMSYESLREHFLSWIAEEGIEGVVWHHPDGRMAKLKVRDFR